MECTLLSLPVEILNLIFRDSSLANDLPSLVKTSCCCKFLRALLAPLLFSEIAFTDDKVSCQSAVLAARIHTQHVQSLHFTARTLPIGWTDGCFLTPQPDSALERQMIQEPEMVLRKAARELLAGTYTPRAGSLTVRFDLASFEFPLDHEVYQGLEIPNLTGKGRLGWLDEEEDEDLRVYESQFIWIARMNAVWQSIVSNPWLTRLRLHNFYPKAPSVSFEPAWKQFLNRLRCLEIAVLLGVTDGVRFANELSFSEYSTDIFVTKSWMSFTDAQRLSRLSLRGSITRNVGCSLNNLLARKPDNMPHLTSLHLHTVLVDDQLGPWLSRHARVLCKLELYDCWVDSSYSSSDELIHSWSQVFGIYADADVSPHGPLALRKLVVHVGGCEDPDMSGPLFTPPSDEWLQHIRPAEKAKLQDGQEPFRGPFDTRHRRAGPPSSFLYGGIGLDRWEVDNWEMATHIDADVTKHCWSQQEDLREYERLLKIAERNAALPEVS